jgi:hypothetical protein
MLASARAQALATFEAGQEQLAIQEGPITTPELGDDNAPCAGDTPTFRTVLLRDPTGPGPLGARLQHIPFTSDRMRETLDKAGRP